VLRCATDAGSMRHILHTQDTLWLPRWGAMAAASFLLTAIAIAVAATALQFRTCRGAVANVPAQTATRPIFLSKSIPTFLPNSIAGFQIWQPNTRHGTVVEGDGGNSTMLYNHDSSIAWFDNRWVVVWNGNGPAHEGVPGQRNYLATTADPDGLAGWSAPAAVFSPRQPRSTRCHAIPKTVFNGSPTCKSGTQSTRLATTDPGCVRSGNREVGGLMCTLGRYSDSSDIQAACEMDEGVLCMAVATEFRGV